MKLTTICAAAFIAATVSTGALAGVDRNSNAGVRETPADTSEALYDAHLGVRGYWHQGPVGIDRPSRRATGERREQAAAGSGARIR